MTAANLDHTHDPAAPSWVESANGHLDFPIQNLPFGVFQERIPAGLTGGEARGGTRIGDEILDLRALSRSGLLTGTALAAARAAAEPRLNELFNLGAGPRKALRIKLFQLLSADDGDREKLSSMLVPVRNAVVRLPMEIGDYTDFYVGINHAITVGTLFRPDNPLLPNYKWVPIGYHGRASSVHVSGDDFHRPHGQLTVPDNPAPSYQPCRSLDFELELGVWIGPGNQAGQPILIENAADHIAGYCLLNDWSARDIQSWESQPLGPFLSKSFHTTVSAWVITPEALAPFRAAMSRPIGDPDPLPYLDCADDQQAGGLDVQLEVLLATAAMRAAGVAPHRLSLSSTRHMYWSTAQLVAHHTSAGCDLRPGDLFGSGTLSGPTVDAYGSLLEISSGGRDVVRLPSGETRTYVQDGDEITLRARAERSGAASIGFGECRAVVLPAVVLGKTPSPDS